MSKKAQTHVLTVWPRGKPSTQLEQYYKDMVSVIEQMEPKLFEKAKNVVFKMREESALKGEITQNMDSTLNSFRAQRELQSVPGLEEFVGKQTKGSADISKAASWWSAFTDWITSVANSLFDSQKQTGEAMDGLIETATSIEDALKNFLAELEKTPSTELEHK